MLTGEIGESNNQIVKKNYGELLLVLAKSVPDGIVVCFSSITHMEEALEEWSKLAIIENLLRYKLIFVESADEE